MIPVFMTHGPVEGTVNPMSTEYAPLCGTPVLKVSTTTYH